MFARTARPHVSEKIPKSVPERVLPAYVSLVSVEETVVFAPRSVLCPGGPPVGLPAMAGVHHVSLDV